MTVGRWILLIFLLLGGGVGALFTIQNLSRTTELSLDLFFVGVELEKALPVPYVMGAAFGVGLLVGMVVMLPAVFRSPSGGSADTGAGEAWT